MSAGVYRNKKGRPSGLPRYLYNSTIRLEAGRYQREESTSMGSNILLLKIAAKKFGQDSRTDVLGQGTVISAWVPPGSTNVKAHAGNPVRDTVQPNAHAQT